MCEIHILSRLWFDLAVWQHSDLTPRGVPATTRNIEGEPLNFEERKTQLEGFFFRTPSFSNLHHELKMLENKRQLRFFENISQHCVRQKNSLKNGSCFQGMKRKNTTLSVISAINSSLFCVPLIKECNGIENRPLAQTRLLFCTFV